MSKLKSENTFEKEHVHSWFETSYKNGSSFVPLKSAAGTQQNIESKKRNGTENII